MSVWDPVRDVFRSLGLVPPELETFDPDVRGDAFGGPLEALPKNRTEVYRVFGNPGVVKVDPKWERANLVVAKELPGRWNNGKGRLYVHRLMEPYLREALRRCRAVGALNEILTMGCFNFRHQRHDLARPLSYHSWGIAVDINSSRNGAHVFKDGKPPEPWSLKWYELWPRGVSEKLVTAFESVGFSWGGRWMTYPDPMHMELVA